MVVANVEVEHCFDQMWIEAQKKSEEKTKKSLVQLKHRRLDDVLGGLDKRFDAHDLNDGGKQEHGERCTRAPQTKLAASRRKMFSRRLVL